jgi:hypothetical protein
MLRAKCLAAYDPQRKEHLMSILDNGHANVKGGESLQRAMTYRQAGFAVIPVECDGSKAPGINRWKPYCQKLPTAAEVRIWFFVKEPRGIAIIGGKVSGGLLVLDFEFRDFFQEWCELVEAVSPGLVARLPVVRTPGKSKKNRGMHVYFRSAGPPVPTRKLALMTPEEAERRTGDKGQITAVEVKGEGGYVLAPGCPADCHKSGRLYKHVDGPPIEETPTLIEAEVKLLLDCARALERGEKASADRAPEPAKGDGDRPGDEFNRRADWGELLPGWKTVRENGEVTYLCRPGKEAAVSASIGYCRSRRGDPKLYVFSTNAAPFEAGRSYSKFEAYALLHHGGDFKAAARDLAKQGYGQQRSAGTGGAKEEGAGKQSQATLLVALAQDAELFHTPGGHDSDGYATLAVNGHRETWPVNSKGFRRWLSKRYYDTHGRTPGSQAVQDALNVIAGQAVYEGPEYEVAVRLAEQDGSVWLDLADRDWHAVRVGPDGWAVLPECPVRFVRKRGMLALPEPARGGSMKLLRPLLNLADDDNWVLFVACLVAALRPDRPFPVLAVNGEQGSAKSTLCRMGRGLIDPNSAPLRRPPRDARDLMIAANNGWVVAYDNLSGIKAELSDCLCCLATGGGFGTRGLYTDDEEKLFSAKRPIMLNGIEDVATRPDLLDRAVTLTLPPIPDEQRRDEDELWRRYEKMRPRVLGALLDAVSAGLKNLAGVKLAGMPRMADFAKWVVACEPALGWEKGAFMSAYSGNVRGANEAALEASSVAGALRLLLEGEMGRPWTGTMADLLEQLGKLVTDKVSGSEDWPRSPRMLSGALRRLAPNLRRAGVSVEFSTKWTRHGRTVTLRKSTLSTVATVATVADSRKPEKNPGDPSNGRPRSTVARPLQTVADRCRPLLDRCRTPREIPRKSNGRNGSNGSNGEKRTSSKRPQQQQQQRVRGP